MSITQLYTAEQCRELDLLAIADKVEGYALMCKAGEAAFALLIQHWPEPIHIHVICGVGNNGGDGMVLARLAKQHAIPVTIHLFGLASQLCGEAKQAYIDAQAAAVNIIKLNINEVLPWGVIVDALLGIGLKGNVRADTQQVIEWINSHTLPVLALDTPSGICADTGNVLGAAVKATQTISFIGAKRGLYTAEAVDYIGEVVVDNLDISPQIFAQVPSIIQLLNIDGAIQKLPKRQASAHKGLFGHVLVIGGNKGMAGAALMAAKAALRVGAGLVSVATLPEHVAAFISAQPEIMVHGVSNTHEVDALLEKATIVIIGPGLGQNVWAEQMLYKAHASGLPLVIDADALNLLSKKIIQAPLNRHCVLTPHPGEAARLLATNITAINVDRFKAAEQLRIQYQATVILKGAGSVIATEAGLAVCPYGNPGMATGGMGDVLSGVIGGLLAQGLSVTDAAQLATVLHAKAADNLAKQHGQKGLLASDVIPEIRRLVNAQ
jgi:NAD(P)H-hydrate epimerase